MAAHPRLLNLIGSLCVGGVAAAMALGLPALDRALPAERRPPADRPYLVGAGVRLLPPEGALLDLTATRPGPRAGAVRFQLGAVRIVVVAGPFSGDLAAAERRLRRKITARRGVQVTGPQAPTSTDAGVPGLSGGYASPGRIGRFQVFLHRGIAVEITVSGAESDLGAVIDRVDASARSLAFRTGR
ncbi:hypothetical protein [Pilimelia columellifera]|uniref:hypothetical protein n=1 Tax=Pilimelia columellifera TaxID=706574 RepID=UPI0031D9EF68